MFKLLNISMVLLALFGMSGCGSTPKTAEKYEVIEPIKTLSTEEFDWNNDRSRAANFARMGQKAGLGFGLRDKSDPRGGVQSAESNKLLDVATGFLAMDLGTGLATAFNENQRDSQVRFSPYIIDFIDGEKNSIGDDGLAKIAMNSLRAKISAGLSNTKYANSVVGAFSDNNPLGMITSRVILQGEICNDGTNYLMTEERKTDKTGIRNANMIIGLESANIDISKACGFEVGSSITGKLDGKLVVIHELVASNLNVFIAQKIAMNTDMAIVFPEYLSFHHASDMQEKYTFKYDYTFVTYDGEQLLFDVAEKSTKPDFQ